jgi:hypothetical protein
VVPIGLVDWPGWSGRELPSRGLCAFAIRRQIQCRRAQCRGHWLDRRLVALAQCSSLLKERSDVRPGSLFHLSLD